jgi:hypothetical protein
MRHTSSMRNSSKKTAADSKANIFVFSFLVVAILSSGFYFARKSGTNHDVYSNDFNVYYHAAREILEGHSPYQDSLSEWTPYLYPPLTAEALIPLALLPLPVAAYIWFVISAASIAASIWMLAAISDGHERVANLLTANQFGLAALAVVVVFRFVLDTFSLGQINTVVAALSIAHVFFFSRQKKTLSAVALILAVSIKLTPAVLLIYHIAKLRLKFVAACVALLAVVTLISFLPFGLSASAFEIFTNRTIKNEQGYNLAESGNQSLRGTIERSIKHADLSTSGDSNGSRNPSDSTTFILSIVVMVFSILSAVWADSELAGVAPFFCCAVLLSPLSWKAHFVILMLPIAYLLFRMTESTRSQFLIAGTLIAAFALFNLTSPYVVGLAAAEWADVHSLVFVGALLIYLALAMTMLRPGQTRPGRALF